MGAFGSFLLWLLLGCASDVDAGELRDVKGVEGPAVECVRRGRGGAEAARASASERWLEKVFWDWRMRRTLVVTLP